MSTVHRQQRVVLATFGTLGDLHPFLAVALELKRRGVEPIVAAAEMYREKVESEGVRFQRMRPDIDAVSERLRMSEPELVQATAKRPDFLVREIVLPHLKEAYEDVLQVAREADLIVTHSAAYGAHLVAETCRLPWLSVALQPMIFFSAYDPPIVATLPKLSQWIYQRGPAWTRAAFELTKRIARRWVEPIESFRRELGLPPSSAHPIFEGQFSPSGTIALYSSLFGPPQPDHPPRTWTVGFAFYDKHSATAPSLDEFLDRDRGDQPIVFTQGTSAVHDAAQFIGESLEAVRALETRAVFVLDEQRAREWQVYGNERVLITGYAPYSQLFPRARVIVHHGGIGTTAQALRSGRPQLIAPYLVDQPDNAHRVERMGCGRTIPLAKYRAANVTEVLQTLTHDLLIERRADEIGQAIRAENGAQKAADLILETLKMRSAAATSSHAG